MKSARSGIVALSSAPVLVFGAMLSIAVLGGAQQTQSSCAGGDAVLVDVDGIPTEVTGGGATYRGEQLANAAAVIRAGADEEVGERGQTIGVMTAIGESTLQVLDYGDAVGPDSRGLFQQRANGSWGSYGDRMDPYRSAVNFYRALKQVSGWETLAPTIAAHRAQRNADPYHYERFWDDAVAIMRALAGADVTVRPGTGGQACTDQTPGQIPVAGDWTRPTTGPVTSGFGMRWGAMHNGLDFGAACGTPVYAAAGGVVVLVAKNNRPPATGYGTLVAIDHGGGTLTRYAHANNQDVLVAVGQQVSAGQQITRVGTYGNSTGCHLHFEVQQGGVFVDPAPFLSARNIAL